MKPTNDARLSVVIPVGPDEDIWQDTMSDVQQLGNADVIWVVTSDRHQQALNKAKPEHHQVVMAGPGRAVQMNVGVSKARGEILWFLHADTRFSPDTLQALRSCIDRAANGLFYFDLDFLKDGPALMPINKVGANFRSRVLKMPFGDQGLLIGKKLFLRLGGYDESLAYGEDHMLVWRARQAGVSVRPTGGTVLTSARKYRYRGWGATTARHLFLTWRQAIPEAIRLLREKREQV